MLKHVALLFLQLTLALIVSVDNQGWVLPLALGPVLVLDRGAFRVLVRGRLLLFLALMVGGVPLVVGTRSADVLGVPYSPEYVDASLLMLYRSLIMLVALRLFTRRIRLDELATSLQRTRFRQFGDAFALSLELLPQLRATSRNAWRAYRRGRGSSGLIAHTRDWTVDFVTNMLLYAERYSGEKVQGEAHE